MKMMLSTLFTLLSLSHCLLAQSTKYLGCYNDDKNDRALDDYSLERNRNMRVDKCINLCKRHMGENQVYYAGLQLGKSCYCGTTYDIHGKAAETECNRNCKGDNTEQCGGVEANAVYEIRRRVPSFDCFVKGHDGAGRTNWATCPEGYQVTACSCGYACGSYSIETVGSQTRCFCHWGCMAGNAPIDWTSARCCRIKYN